MSKSMREAQPSARSRWARNVQPPLLLNSHGWGLTSISPLVCELFKGSGCILFISVSLTEPSTGAHPCMLMSKSSADIRRQKLQNRMKAAPCQGVWALGAFHRSVISGSEDTEPSLTGRSSQSFKDDRWTRTVPCGVTCFPGGAHAVVASVLTPAYLLAFRSFFPPGVLPPDTQHPILLSQSLLEQRHRLLPA